MTHILPEPGWYEDPGQHSVMPYWNGEQWTPLVEDPTQTSVGQARRPPDVNWPPPVDRQADGATQTGVFDHWEPTRSRHRTALTVALLAAGIVVWRLTDTPNIPLSGSGEVEVTVVPNSCKGGEISGSLRLIVRNGSQKRAAVTISIIFFDAQRSNIGEGLAVLRAIDPGAETEIEAFGVLEDDHTLVSCELANVLTS